MTYKTALTLLFPPCNDRSNCDGRQCTIRRTAAPYLCLKVVDNFFPDFFGVITPSDSACAIDVINAIIIGINKHLPTPQHHRRWQEDADDDVDDDTVMVRRSDLEVIDGQMDRSRLRNKNNNNNRRLLISLLYLTGPKRGGTIWYGRWPLYCESATMHWFWFGC